MLAELRRLKTTTEVAINETTGVPYFVTRPKIGYANFSLLIAYSILVEAYKPELPADNIEVKITAFITLAAKANPAFLNTIVNGEAVTLLVSSSLASSAETIEEIITLLQYRKLIFSKKLVLLP